MGELSALGIDIGGTSVKACLIDGDRFITAQSPVYTHPSRDELCLAIQAALSSIGDRVFDSVGLCLPGKRSSDNRSIERSVNLPCINGWLFDDLLLSALGTIPCRQRIVSDIDAAGSDYVLAHGCTGRSAIIAIGTGVGLCVVDEGQIVGIGKRGIGHLGLMDMGRLSDVDRVANDGSVNTLESFVGARAIADQFPNLAPDQLAHVLCAIPFDEPFMKALIRAVRIVHAIYVPDRVVLMGGVGIALSSLHDELDHAIREGLTSLASPNWTLAFGDDAFHSARGAARLASFSV